jgi:hypothetical protein
LKLRLFQNPRKGRKHLPGLHRLEQVVGKLRPQRIVHKPVFFAFGHHNYREGWPYGLDLRQHVESAWPGHVLVEQHAIQGFGFDQDQGIASVGGG